MRSILLPKLVGVLLGLLIASSFAYAACPTPTNLRESGRTFNSVWLSFAAVPGASGYNLEWKEATATTWTSVSLLITGEPRIEYNLKPLAYGSTYNWRVQTVCSENETSPVSVSQTFSMTCPEPDSLRESVSPTAAILHWSAPAGLNQFTLRWRIADATAWNTIPDISTSSYSLTGLTPGTAYEWQLASQCADGTSSAMTAPQTFTATCSAPIGLRHSYGTSTSAILYWQPILGSTVRFRVRYRAFDTNTPWTETNLTANSYLDITGLTSGTTYEWGVQTLCSSEPTSFAVGPPFTATCMIPAFLNLYNITGSSATFSWGTYGGNAQYELQWRLQGQTTWPNNTTVSGSSYSLSNLTANTVYEYRFRMRCSDGNASEFRPVETFRTLSETANCVALDGIGPTRLKGTTAEVVFGIGRATTANVRWREAGATNWTSFTVATTFADPGWSVVFGSLTGLTLNSVYEWQAQAVCSQTAASAFTPLQTFTALCGTPNPTLIRESPVTFNQMQLTWQSLANIAYRAEWRPRSTTPVAWTTIEVAAKPFDDYSFALANNISPGQAYEWRVQSVCSATNASVFTQPRSFSTSCVAPQTLLVNSVTSAGARVSWQLPTGWTPLPNAQFRVRWRPLSGGAWTESPLVSNLTFDIQPLLKTGYNFQVQQVCSNQPGDYSTQNGLILPYCWSPGPGYPFGLTQQPISSVTSNSVSLSWHTFGLGERYELQWHPSGTTSWPNSLTTVTSPFALTGLAPGTTYEWRIRTICAENDYSDFTGSYSFTTLACTGMQTVKAGAWSDPAVWSCNRIPTASDPVEIRHLVTIPEGQTGNAQRVRYETGGQISLGSNGRLQLNQ